jgi:hypothetical protein
MTAASSRLAALAVVALASVAHAQSPSATELFKQARDDYKAGKYAEACAKFVKSQEMDPQLGTLFNIGQCDEKLGKLASAIAAFREVVAKDNNAKRKALAAEYQSKLEQRVPKLVVQVAKPPQGLVVTLDGPTGAKPIDANLPIEMDFGDYTVIARADGFREMSSKVKIDHEGDTTTVPVTLALVHDQPADKTDKHAEPERIEATAPAPRTHSHRKTYGVVTSIVGGAVAATGLVFGSLAHSKWNDAQAVCGGTTCPTQAQVDMANQLAGDARSAGNISTALFVGGGVLVATGLVLWLTAPSDEHAVSVTASTGATTGVVLSGRY